MLRGDLNQTARQGLSARIRFASANMILNFASCFRRPRYRVFLNLSKPFTTPKTCSTLERTEDFACSLRDTGDGSCVTVPSVTLCIQRTVNDLSAITCDPANLRDFDAILVELAHVFFSFRFPKLLKLRCR